MTGRIPGRTAKLAVTLLAAFVVAAYAAAGAGAAKIYNNLPSRLPGNMASIGNEAYSNSELGSLVTFAGADRYKAKVTVGMSAWACEEGNPQTDTCVSRKSDHYEMPMRLNVYNVGPGGSVGSLIVSEERSFAMPYRPSSNKKCTGEQLGEWWDAREASCYHGKAFKVTFALPAERRLPEQAIISVQYNTSDHGPSPIGAAPCQSTASGCYYDSLNVALVEPAENDAPVGTNPSPNELYANTEYNEIDCGSSENLGTFGPTGACWEGDQVGFTVKASRF